jgi:hypothetical protein
VCDPKTADCQIDTKAMDAKPCDADDSPCTPFDVCQGGMCKAGAPIVCKLPVTACEVAKCVKKGTDFACVVGPKQDGEPCAESDACFIGAACQAGQCQKGSQERFFAKDHGPAGKRTALYGVAAAADGHVVVAGGTWTEAGGKVATSAWWLARLNRFGKPVWQHELASQEPHADARAAAVQALDDGGFVAAGTVGKASAGLNAQAVRVDAGGELLWQKDFGKATAQEVVRALDVSASGAMVLAGGRQEGGASEAWVLRLSATGGYIWDAPLTTGGGEVRAV